MQDCLRVYLSLPSRERLSTVTYKKVFPDLQTLINTSGTLFNGASVDGIAGLRQNLVAQPEIFVGVMTEKMLTYALGRGIEYYDMPAVRRIVRDATKDEYKFSTIVKAIVQSEQFRMRRVPQPALAKK